MKLFVLEVADYWEYCGGGAVVLANDIEEVCKLIKDKKEELYIVEVDKDVPTNIVKRWERSAYAEKKFGTYQILVVKEVFEVKTEINESRIVMLDYNYS